MERTTVGISIRKSAHIKRQGVDPDAAYKRVEIIRRHKKEMLAEINETNTADIVGEHAQHIDDAMASLDLLVLDDLTIIHQGE